MPSKLKAHSKTHKGYSCDVEGNIYEYSIILLWKISSQNCFVKVALSNLINGVHWMLTKLITVSLDEIMSHNLYILFTYLTCFFFTQLLIVLHAERNWKTRICWESIAKPTICREKCFTVQLMAVLRKTSKFVFILILKL